jgi:branched-chain amino acid transport system ATP-binding protein
MAGLSHAEVDDILELLFRANADGVAVVMIEHIMRAVTTFSERLVVFVAGRAIADGPTQEILRRKDVEAAYLGE